MPLKWTLKNGNNVKFLCSLYLTLMRKFKIFNNLRKYTKKNLLELVLALYSVPLGGRSNHVVEEYQSQLSAVCWIFCLLLQLHFRCLSAQLSLPVGWANRRHLQAIRRWKEREITIYSPGSLLPGCGLTVVVFLHLRPQHL